MSDFARRESGILVPAEADCKRCPKYREIIIDLKKQIRELEDISRTRMSARRFARATKKRGAGYTKKRSKR